jgi:hypothetical protein
VLLRRFQGWLEYLVPSIEDGPTTPLRSLRGGLLKGGWTTPKACSRVVGPPLSEGDVPPPSKTP